MPNFFSEDFAKLSSDEYDDVTSTGYGIAGTPGTPEHAQDAAEAFALANGDIFYDYNGYVLDDGYPAAAAMHANISRLQSAATYAAELLQALASHPELLAAVQQAVVDNQEQKLANASPRV